MCALPGCVWSGPRPEELKALNVIIRAVGEPSSNHTQITYTLTPTYNTSHPRAARVRVYVHGLKEEKKGLMERKNERQEGYVHPAIMHPVLLRSVCAQTSVWPQCEQHVNKCVCVCVTEEKRRVFFSPLFLPPSPLSTCQSYSISHPSIFHFYMQLQM